MNKKELLKEIHKRTGIPTSQANKVISAFTSIVTEQVSNKEVVRLIGFGTFKTFERKEKIGTDPRDKNKKILVPKRTFVKFKASDFFNKTIAFVQKEDIKAIHLDEKGNKTTKKEETKKDSKQIDNKSKKDKNKKKDKKKNKK